MGLWQSRASSVVARSQPLGSVMADREPPLPGALRLESFTAERRAVRCGTAGPTSTDLTVVSVVYTAKCHQRWPMFIRLPAAGPKWMTLDRQRILAERASAGRALIRSRLSELFSCKCFRF